MDARKILGPDGLISKKFPGFESRPQQLDMADAVADALDRRSNSSSKRLMMEGWGPGRINNGLAAKAAMARLRTSSA